MEALKANETLNFVLLIFTCALYVGVMIMQNLSSCYADDRNQFIPRLNFIERDDVLAISWKNISQPVNLIAGKVYLGGNHWTTGHPAGYTVKVVVRNRKKSVVQGGCCKTSGP